MRVKGIKNALARKMRMALFHPTLSVMKRASRSHHALDVRRRSAKNLRPVVTIIYSFHRTYIRWEAQGRLPVGHSSGYLRTPRKLVGHRPTKKRPLFVSHISRPNSTPQRRLTLCTTKARFVVSFMVPSQRLFVFSVPQKDGLFCVTRTRLHQTWGLSYCGKSRGVPQPSPISIV